jgi:hypothetical protein
MPGHSGHSGALDPMNPLAAVAQPFKSPGAAPVQAMAQPQRIEVDEAAVQQARRGGFKGGLVAGIVFGLVLLVLGWVGGNASSQGGARSQSVNDAHGLAGDLQKAKESLELVKQKVTDGGKSLLGDNKFPADLAQQLSAINVDFKGDKLFGRRFSGVPAETTTELFDFIARVQAFNDKKDLIVALLTKLQKPITDELARKGQTPIAYVVVVDKETSSSGAFLAPLAAPISPEDKGGVPNELTFANPRGSGNVKLPRLQGDRIPSGGAAITIVPNTYEKVCPSSTHGQVAQLVTSMNSLVDDIGGQKNVSSDVIVESKPGLSDTAMKLADQLSKVN